VGDKVADDDSGTGGIDLAEAIEALRAELENAWRKGLGGRIRFRLQPVEMTVQAGVTRTGTGTAGVKWHVLALGGERSRQEVTTQTLVLRLDPILYSIGGDPFPDEDQTIADEQSLASADDPL
jgi:hypothetical protein